jgi:hypothetical protein
MRIVSPTFVQKSIANLMANPVCTVSSQIKKVGKPTSPLHNQVIYYTMHEIRRYHDISEFHMKCVMTFGSVQAKQSRASFRTSGIGP